MTIIQCYDLLMQKYSNNAFLNSFRAMSGVSKADEIFIILLTTNGSINHF